MSDEGDEGGDGTTGLMLREVSLEFMPHATALVAVARERDDLSEMLKESQLDRLNLAEERDHLRVEAEKAAGTSLGAMRREVAQLRDMLAAAKAEIADVRRALDAHGHDGTFEAAAKQRAEVAQLRATITRLRKHVEKSTIVNEHELEEIINAE